MGCRPEDADSIAEVLVAAELRGIGSHGMMRVKDYFQMWEAGKINATPSVKIVHETPSTAVVDGGNGFGIIAAKKSMELALEKAEKAGTGWVATRNSNHFGIAGYYSMMALEREMIGWAMTNANPLVAPTFSTSRFLGTNPIAIAIPAGKQAPFVADFATTPIARGKLALMEKKGVNAPLGYVQDAQGYPSEDPAILKEGGAIVPLGGDYEHGSHKGYCMGAIVDIFSSVLSGANFGPFVPPQVPYIKPKDKKVGEGLGHYFGAMRIDAFQPADHFKAKMDEWIETFRAAEKAEGKPEVMIPGDPERANEAKYRKSGIPILPGVVSDLEEVASKLGLEFRE
jgi:LDH2 family malate/lactate/ureidoglycolate dehydrogenase